MGYIKEPDGVDLFVGPSILTEANKRLISEAITAYKATHPPLPRDFAEAMRTLQPAETITKAKKTAAV